MLVLLVLMNTNNFVVYNLDRLPELHPDEEEIKANAVVRNKKLEKKVKQVFLKVFKVSQEIFRPINCCTWTTRSTARSLAVLLVVTGVMRLLLCGIELRLLENITK